MKKSRKLKITKSLPLAILIPLTSMVPITSCGIFTTKTWDFITSTNKGNEINYCLLIGQNDHSDSIERTRYTRKALGTLDETEPTKTRTKNNPNIAEPINGKTLTVHYGSGGYKRHDFVVNEIEHMEQKSLAGATWDAITANATAETWIAKHGNKITFIVSNNDGMAEGAYWACNWIKGLPIFGYDANSTTIEKIAAGRITGTVDQNASTQAGAMTIMLRNMLEDRDNYWANGCTPSVDNHWYGKTIYNPVYYTKDGTETGKKIYRGFKDPEWVEEETPSEVPYGYTNFAYISLNEDPSKGGSHFEINTARDILIKSLSITDKNVQSFINQETGEAKTPKEMVDDITKISGIPGGSKNYNICQTYASKSEAYLIATMKPYIDTYAERLGLPLTVIQGDGTDESVIINAIDALGTDVDGYLINMVKTTATSSYITALAKKAYSAEKSKVPSRPEAGSDGWEKFEDRLDTPVIFWNRQPHTDGGDIDTSIMNNKFFKYTYYVGVDAAAGGEVQGQMILEKIGEWADAYLNGR